MEAEVVVESNETNQVSQEQLYNLSNHLDIGLYVNKRPGTDDLIMSLLETPWIPGAGYKFPKITKRNVSFQQKWLDEYKWLSYSDVHTGAFCKFCVLFSHKNQQQNFGHLVHEPYVNWIHARRDFTSHQNSKSHTDCVLLANGFMNTTRGKQPNILNQIDSFRAGQVKKNRDGLASIIESIIFCGRQEIPLRGHRDHGPLTLEEPKENEGNFRALLRMRLICGDENLRAHLQSRNYAAYLSPNIQNEVIDTIGSHIQEKLVSRINNAKCFSVIADETTDIAGVEQLSICARYIDNNIIRKDFLGFVPMVGTTGEEIANSIINLLKSLNVEVQYLRGQGYDGTNSMSGSIKGVQTRIRNEISQKALYVHCSSHSLNLALSDSCTIPEIRNTLGTIGKIITFVTRSAIRLDILKSCIQSNYNDLPKSVKLISYCDTRFAERHDSVLRFVELFDCVIDTLGLIEVDGDKEAKVAAHLYLNAALSPTFIVTMYICQQLLSCTVYLSRGLQNPQYDLITALKQVDNCISNLNTWRSEAETNFKEIFQKAENCACNQFVTMSVPRQATRQVHRSNAPAGSPEEYYRRNIYLKFLDHMLSSLKDRFRDHRSIIKGLQYLVPSLLDEKYSPGEVLSFYEDDLSESDSTVRVELTMWAENWKMVSVSDRPKDAISAYVSCDELCFPNVKMLLKILATLPVSSNCAERSFSTIRRLKSYLRSTTGENRLNGLALMTIHREIDIKISDVINTFAARKARKLDLLL